MLINWCFFLEKMSDVSKFFILFVIMNILMNTKAQKPEKLGTCKVKLADGTFINLKPLDKPSSPRVAALKDYNYKFNPCKFYFRLKIKLNNL